MLFFFLYLDGHTYFGAEDGHQAARYLNLVYRLGLGGHTDAFVDTVEFSSSKVGKTTGQSVLNS